MDSRRPPQRIGEAHLADQPANVQRHSRSTAAASRFPAPIRSETFAYRKSNPDILMVQSAQGRTTKIVPVAIDGARDR
jgi:hypothetical protein